jgi:hypothetical protein
MKSMSELETTDKARARFTEIVNSAKKIKAEKEVCACDA